MAAQCPQSNSNFSSVVGCPIDHRNMMPTGLNTPNANTSVPLSNERIQSSIPRADAGQSDTWLYPSQLMFYNAMHKKGHQPDAKDMDVIVTIHNIVNEQTWQQVLKQEHAINPEEKPKLKRFLGRPESTSPKAFMRKTFLGYAAPFDRHDWYVERSDGSIVRYVIDFYSAAAKSDQGASFHIDARLAIDSPQCFLDRMRLSLNEFITKMK